jgi:hypothetical protein
MSSSAPNQTWKVVVALVVLLGAGLGIAWPWIVIPPKPEAAPHIGVGRTLAREAARLTTSRRVVLFAPDVRAYDYPGAEIQLQAFYEEARASRLTVAATNFIKLDPLRVSRVPVPDFERVIRKTPETDVIVSLFPIVLPSAEQVARLPSRHARVVALYSGNSPRNANLRQLFESGLLDIAIVSRAEVPLKRPPSGDVAAWFDYLFQVVNKARPDVSVGAAGAQSVQ